MRDSGSSGIAQKGRETLQGGNANRKVSAGMTEIPSSPRAASSAAEPLDQPDIQTRPDHTPDECTLEKGKDTACPPATSQVPQPKTFLERGGVQEGSFSLDMVSHRDRSEVVGLSSPSPLHQRCPRHGAAILSPHAGRHRAIYRKPLVGCAHLCPSSPNIHKAEEVQEARTIGTRPWDSSRQETGGCYSEGKGCSSIRKSWPPGGRVLIFLLVLDF